MNQSVAASILRCKPRAGTPKKSYDLGQKKPSRLRY
jgi:hypothetical protein